MRRISQFFAAAVLVCFSQFAFADEAPLLKAGYYATESDFCSQEISWNADELNIHAVDGCDVTLILKSVSRGVYEGKAVGFDYNYRVTVKDDEHYTFDSIDFNTSGDFHWVQPDGLPNRVIRPHSVDPTQF